MQYISAIKPKLDDHFRDNIMSLKKHALTKFKNKGLAYRSLTGEITASRSLYIENSETPYT